MAVKQNVAPFGKYKTAVHDLGQCYTVKISAPQSVLLLYTNYMLFTAKCVIWDTAPVMLLRSDAVPP